MWGYLGDFCVILGPHAPPHSWLYSGPHTCCPAAIYQSPASQAGQHVTRICGVYFGLWESYTQSSDIMISPCVIVKWYHSMHLPMVMVLKVATCPTEEVASSGQNVLSRHPHVSSQQVWRSCCWRNHTLLNGIRVICCTAIWLHTHIRWVMSGKKKDAFWIPRGVFKVLAFAE